MDTRSETFPFKLFVFTCYYFLIVLIYIQLQRAFPVLSTRFLPYGLLVILSFTLFPVAYSIMQWFRKRDDITSTPQLIDTSKQTREENVLRISYQVFKSLKALGMTVEIEEIVMKVTKELDHGDSTNIAKNVVAYYLR